MDNEILDDYKSGMTQREVVKKYKGIHTSGYIRSLIKKSGISRKPGESLKSSNKKYKCKYCDKVFNSGRSKASHSKWCNSGPHREKSLTQSRGSIDAMMKARFTGIHICQYCNIEYDNMSALNAHKLSCKLNPKRLDRTGQRLGYKHTKESRKKISEGRLKVIQNNPDLIYHHYGPSKPELFLINRFRNLGFNVLDQYHDKRWNRGFKIDLYFPDKLLGIEVNGAFKYTKDGLKKYYINRSKLILDTSGIKIIDLYYTKVYTLTDEQLISLIS